MSVFYRELQNNYSPCHNHRHVYQQIHRQTMQIPMRATVRLPGRSNLPMESLTKATNPMRDCFDTYLPTTMLMDFEKSRGIFKILVRNSKNTNRNYRRNLMPPPKKILFYVPSVTLQYKTQPPLRGSFFL
jgi:molybdenum cofactor biosynthesis enzyme